MEPTSPSMRPVSPFSQKHVHMPYHELRIFPSPGSASLDSPTKGGSPLKLKQRGSPGKGKQTANKEMLASRHFLKSSIVARVSEKAAVPTVHFEDTISRGISGGRFQDTITNSSGTSDLARELESMRGQGSWKEVYNRRVKTEGDARAAKREKEEYDRKHYKPRVPDLTKAYSGYQIDSVTAPEPWQDVWGRNINCERCWEHCAPGSSQVKCYTCPVVQHKICTFGPNPGPTPALWLCDACVAALEDSVSTNRRQSSMKELRRRQEEAAVKVQSVLRMVARVRFHQRFLRGIHRMQGICRGKRARKAFRTKFSLYWRPIKIKVLEAEATVNDVSRFTDDKISNASVIVTLMNVEHEDLVKQDFRGDTSLVPLEVNEEEHEDVGWVTFEDTITVPCSQAHVNAVFTMTTTTPKLPNESDAANTEFLGQVSVNLHECLLYSRRIEQRELRLGLCETEPLEKGSSKNTRLYNLWGDAHGHITVDIHPGSFTTSIAGYLDEVTNAYAKNASKKRWFCILVDGKMLIQLHPQDPKPKQTRHMKDSIIKWHKTGVIDIQTGSEGTILLTAPDENDLRKWLSRLRVAAGTHPNPYPIRHPPKPVAPPPPADEEEGEGGAGGGGEGGGDDFGGAAASAGD